MIWPSSSCLAPGASASDGVAASRAGERRLVRLALASVSTRALVLSTMG
jgi:hypothetical protein